MKRVKAVFTLVVLVLAAAASAPALAGHHGGGHVHHGGGHVRFGVFVGPGFWYPPPYYRYAPYYYPPYYYPPVVPVPMSPPTYVEQGGAQPAPALPQGYWYYCDESKAYYPYVKECPGGWQQVAPQPAG